MLLNLEQLRKDYALSALELNDTAANPYEQFAAWMQSALKEKLPEPAAMTLATVDANGQPNARMVLLKGMKLNEGFIFYTNYRSQKGQELDANPKAALVFYWEAMQRQIRIQGHVQKISREDSTAYFQSRPKGSQIGAMASPQSQVLQNRQELEKEVLRLNEKYKSLDKLPRPENWGGYILIPDYFEFWQGRSSRLHDRIRYRLEEGKWERERLAP